MGYRAEYTPFCASPQQQLSRNRSARNYLGGPVGLPSGGSGGAGRVIGPVGVSAMALRVAGKETVVVSSSATANQRKLLFTV